jgi:Co/Zn/Cd efflux system component
MEEFRTIDRAARGETVILLDERVSRILLAVCLNVAAIACNLVTFWFLGARLPAMHGISMQATNDLTSYMGVIIGALSLFVGWRYVGSIANRVSFALICALTIVISMGTLS